MAKSKKSDSMAAPAVDPNHDEWQVKNHLDKIMEAEEIKNDPEKMEKVHKLAGRHHKALSHLIQPKKITSIDGIKKARNEMAMKKMGKM